MIIKYLNLENIFAHRLEFVFYTATYPLNLLRITQFAIVLVLHYKYYSFHKDQHGETIRQAFERLGKLIELKTESY